MRSFSLTSGFLDRMERNVTSSFAIFPFVQETLMMGPHPGFRLQCLVGVEGARHVPQMLASLIEVDNFDGPREGLGGQIPDPFRPVAHHDLQVSAVPSARPRFAEKAGAELLGGFDAAGIRGGIGSTDGIALLLPSRLSEDAAQLHFPRMRGSALDFALPTCGLLFHHGNSRPIHLYIEDLPFMRVAAFRFAGQQRTSDGCYHLRVLGNMHH